MFWAHTPPWPGDDRTGFLFSRFSPGRWVDFVGMPATGSMLAVEFAEPFTQNLGYITAPIETGRFEGFTVPEPGSVVLMLVGVGRALWRGSERQNQECTKMIDWLAIKEMLGLGVDGLSLLQFITGAKQRNTDLTIQDYQEWLRRKGHTELLEKLQHNQQALDAIAQILEQAKDSVINAILHHGDRTSGHLQEIADELRRQGTLDEQRLKIMVQRPPHQEARSPHPSLEINYDATNPTNRHIVIVTGHAWVKVNQHRTKLNYHYPKSGFLDIGPHAVGTFLMQGTPGLSGLSTPVNYNEVRRVEYIELQLRGMIDPVRYEPTENDRIYREVKP